MKTYTRLWKYLAELYLECEIFQTKFVDNSKTQLHVRYFFLKLCHLWDNVGKYDKNGRTTDDNIMLSRKDAFCIQDNSDNYRDTHW
jgi:hypothetical protein